MVRFLLHTAFPITTSRSYRVYTTYSYALYTSHTTETIGGLEVTVSLSLSAEFNISDDAEESLKRDL